jgi:hypothetical protein
LSVFPQFHPILASKDVQPLLRWGMWVGHFENAFSYHTFGPNER